MSDTNIDVDPDNYSDEILTPRRVRPNNDGKVYDDTFSHGEIDMTFDREKVFIRGPEVVDHGDRVFYKYEGKPPVMITEDGVHKHNDAPARESGIQAFFVLSMLDEHGMVSRFRKD